MRPPRRMEISQGYFEARNTRRKNTSSRAYPCVSHDVICNFKAAPFTRSADQLADFYVRRNANVIARALSHPLSSSAIIESRMLFFPLSFFFFKPTAAVSVLGIGERERKREKEREIEIVSSLHDHCASFSELCIETCPENLFAFLQQGKTSIYPSRERERAYQEVEMSHFLSISRFRVCRLARIESSSSRIERRRDAKLEATV